MTDMFRTNTPPKPGRPPQISIPTYRAEDLTQGGDTAMICLGGQTYTLRITRAGKLILTK
jgi:hemin uptake protein HemP